MPTSILIADDNRNIRTVVKMDLESLGFKVFEAIDGFEALAIVKEHHPDLIVLDVMMPNMDGYEVCFKLKEDPDLRNIPVIMLTAKTTKEDKFLGREVGADEYLTKPFDPEELEKIIQRILESRRKGEADHRLTGLPMWQAVRNEISRRKERGEDFVVVEGCYEPELFDIYQKKYGNIKADEVIGSTADILRSTVSRWADLFLGHTGDNIFFLISTPGNVEEARKHINRKLADSIPFFYDDHDRQAGGITLRGMDGSQKKIGLMKWIWKVSDAE